MPEYEIPNSLVAKFSEVAASNFCEKSGRHIETIAYLVGYEQGDTLVGTHLVFPSQTGNASKVDDEGKL